MQKVTGIGGVFVRANDPAALRDSFRVRDLDAMVAQLRSVGIDVTVDPEKYPNGRFAKLHDPEGNPIELWEPADPLHTG